MSVIDTGGSAFPVAEMFDERRGEVTQYASEGMTLRDYFAAKVLVATYMNGFAGPADEHRAKICYRMADAMLKAREA